VSCFAKRTLIHGIHTNPLSSTLRFNLATILREKNVLPGFISDYLRLLATGLHLDRTHLPSRLAIAAAEYDTGNILNSEVHLIDALHTLRLRNLSRLRCHLSDHTLRLHGTAVRILILTNIAVLHQRHGQHVSAEGRYKQIAQLRPHLLGTHKHLHVHASWCQSTNALAMFLARSHRDIGDKSSINKETSKILQCAMEVPMKLLQELTVLHKILYISGH